MKTAPRTGILLAVVAAVLIAASYGVAGSAGALTVAVVLAIVAVGGARSLLGPLQRPAADRRRPALNPPFPSYERMTYAVVWATGSQRDWDLHLRPVLAQLLDVVVSERYRTDLTRRPELGPRLLGEELWPLVDPAAAPAPDRDTPGPGRRALLRILDRLETA